jgi:hypothetical protein
MAIRLPIEQSTYRGTSCVNFSLTSGQYHKPFTSITYDNSKICYTMHYIYDPMQYFQNTLAYFATAVSYGCNICMKLTRACTIQLFAAVIYCFGNKLERLSLASLFNLV